MRLIDADKIHPDCTTKHGKLAISQSQLANAPTVEPFEPDYVGAERLKAKQKGYEEGYHFGMKVGKTLNPKIKQGEWIFNKLTGDTICSRCRRARRDTRTEHIYYCNHCGAKMET